MNTNGEEPIQPGNPGESGPSQPAAPVPRKRRRLLWNLAGLTIALAAIAGALALWGNSRQFENMVRNYVANAVQDATGGRVEIASFQWHLFALQAEAAGVVIHGDEPATEVPYARIEKLNVRLSILGLLSPRILLRNLEITRPQIHLILYRDNTTNQPQPAKQRTGGTPAIDTLFNLQAGHVAVEQGLIDIDDRAANVLDFKHYYQPLDFHGDNIELIMQYVAATSQAPAHYHLDAGARDLSLTRSGTLKDTPAVHGYLQTSIDLMRDVANIRSMRITARTKGAPDRSLDITGSVGHFASPQWQAAIDGDLDLRLLDPILGYPFAPEGIAHLKLTSAGHEGEFRIDGSVHAEKASYIGTGVVARNIDLRSQVHADSHVLRITSVAIRLPQGGEIDGEVLLDHWLPLSAAPIYLEEGTTPAPKPRLSLRKRLERSLHHPQPTPKPPAPPHSTLVVSPPAVIPVNGKVNAQFKNVTVDTILDLVGHPPFQRLGIDALINGPANADWSHGDAGTLSVTTTLSMTGSGRLFPGENPGAGVIEGTYTQRDGAVNLRNFELTLPASHLTAHGRVGANPLTSPTSLNVDFHTTNIAEFDTILRSLGMARNGQSGAAAMPVGLNGQADFHGAWAGSIASPRLSGDVKATQVNIQLPPSLPDAFGNPQTLHWDSIEAQGSYDAERIAIIHCSLTRGPTQIAVDGTLTAEPPPPDANPRRRGATQPSYNSNAALHLNAHAQKLTTADVLPLLGVNAPITGSLNARITADGPLNALSGSGSLQLDDAAIYGEPVTTLHAQGSLSNKILNVTSASANGPAGAVTFSGKYDLNTRRFDAQASSDAMDLAKIERLRSTIAEVTGRLGFHLTASGTQDDPRVEGRASIADLKVQGQSLGAVDLTAHTANRLLLYDGSTHFESTGVKVHGQTALHTPYATEATLDFDDFDVGTILRLRHITSFTAQSALSGAAQVSGPLAHPLEMRGDLRLQQMAVVVSGVHLKSENGLHAALTDGRVTLDPLHVTGEETDLRAQGTLGLRDTRRIDFAANGSVNLKLLETLDSDITAGGTSSFQIEAHGPLSAPDFRGRIQFDNGALALEDLPNGLSQLHGTLEFSQNRLEIRSLTAMTGGGQLSLGGYLAYQHGLYANVSVTGRSIRIRYPDGVSSLADANLQLHGTQTSLLLSGNILITRFSVSPDLDVAALAARANAVSPITSPNAPSNHVRLDLRIQSSPQLNFQNAVAKLAGDVDLRLRGTVASPSLQGRISITEGNATIGGTHYELQRGDITFTNPVRIQPNIDLTATARVQDYDISLGLHGTPDKMSVSYRSDPPLPEADVLALLALGRTQSSQGIYTEQQQVSAGVNPSTDVLLGGALNATVSSRVQKLFGAGSVKVDPSYLSSLGNSTTRITVEEQLGKYVTLVYATNVDTTAQQLLQADIAINRHVSLQVTRDESGVFSLVIKATRRYR